MDTCDLLNYTAEAIATKADKLGGLVEPFVDINSLHDALKASPGTWRVLVHWAGETGINDGRGRKLRIGVIVQAAKGLSIDSGAGVTRGTSSGRAAIMEIRDHVDSWVRSLRYFRTRIVEGEMIKEKHPRIHCQGWNFVSSDWLIAADYPARQIRTYYNISCSLPGLIAPIEVEIPAESLKG